MQWEYNLLHHISNSGTNSVVPSRLYSCIACPHNHLGEISRGFFKFQKWRKEFLRLCKIETKNRLQKSSKVIKYVEQAA